MNTRNIIITGVTVVGLGIFAIYATDNIREEKNRRKVEIDISKSDSIRKQNSYDIKVIKIINESIKQKKDLIRCYVLDIPKPTINDIKELNKDERYGDNTTFSDFVKEGLKNILPNLQKEKVDELISIIAEFIFKSDILNYRYFDSKIDFFLLKEAEIELSNITKENIKSILSEEEFKNMGLYAKSTLPENKFEFKVFYFFPELQKKDSKIKTLDNLYEFIYVSTLEHALNFREEYYRNNMKKIVEFNNYEISLLKNYKRIWIF